MVTNKKYQLKVSASMVALCAASILPAQAQDVNENDAANGEDVIVVTGSRITRDSNLSSVAPITALDSDAILRTGKRSVEDIVSELPALTGSIGAFESLESGALTGVNTLNLRNLGEERTLVLVNGRRHVGADASGVPTVDTNTIPVSLIERVEVTTGGASSIYGADAVSGVVNFILKDDFEGVEANAQFGISDEGDAEEYSAYVTIGENFGGGRGNIYASYEFRKSEELLAEDRPFSSIAEGLNFVNNEFGVDDDPNVPDQVRRTGAQFLVTAPDTRLDFNSGTDLTTGEELGFNDRPLNFAGLPFETGELVSGFIGLNGDGTPFQAFRSQLAPNFKSHNFNSGGHYDFTDEVRGFFEFKYTRSRADSLRRPSFTSYLTLALDNPYIPQALTDELANIADPSLNIGRDDFEFIRVDDNLRETTRFVVGLEGVLDEWLKYEVSYNRGVSKIEALTRNARIEDRYFAAIDAVRDPATGEIVCRSTLDPSAVPNIDEVISDFRSENFAATFTPGPGSGCVPFNIFETVLKDPESNADAIAWISDAGNPLVERGKYLQNVVNGYVGFDSSVLDYELPGGPVSIVLGGEYRTETVENILSDREKDPRALVWGGVGVDSTPPTLKSAELFAETSVPIIGELGPFIDQITIDASYRFSDYSAGDAFEATTHAWAAGGIWDIYNDLRIRGSYAKAVRIPNLDDLFRAVDPTSFGVSHPCDINNPQDPNTVANCSIALGALGIDAATYVDPAPGGRLGQTSGNPNLEPETARTFTVGALYRPSFIDNLVLSVDYWHISLSNGILNPSPGDIAEQCFASPTLDNQFCELFDLEPGSGTITNVSVAPVNVATFETGGIDFTMNYGFDLASVFGSELGTLNIRALGTYLDEYVVQPTVDPLFNNEVGQAGTLLGFQAPKWNANIDFTWEYEKLSFNWGVNYHSRLLSSSFDFTDFEAEADLADDPFIPALFNHDIRMSYAATDNLNAYVGVNNLFDRQPFNNSADRGIPVNPVGRFIYFGVNLEFGSIRDIGRVF